MHLSVSCQAARRLQAHYCRTGAGDEGRAPEARRFYHKPAPKCTNEKCGSANCKFYESRPRKSEDASDRYKCVECGRRLAYRPGFLGRHYDDAAISGAIGDAADGKSLGAAARSVPKYLQSERVPVRSTVLRWMQQAKRATAKIPKNIPVRVGGKWNADEICFPTDKGGRYMAGVMEAESMFMPANETYPEAENLQTYDATDMFRWAVRIAKAVPDVLTRYTLSGFARGFKNAIARRGKYRKKGQKPVRVRTASVQNRHINNSLFECQNGTVRNRIKTVLGFNSENPALLFLFITHYSFVRPHMGLNGKTPAEATGIRTEPTSGLRFWRLRPHADQRASAARPRAAYARHYTCMAGTGRHPTG